MVSHLIYPFETSPQKMSAKKTFDLTPENAFDQEYIAEMQSKGYTLNDSTHARIILDDIQSEDPLMLDLIRNSAKGTLKSQPAVQSITITNKSRTFKEIVLP
jgi:hypothetical protein